MEVQLGARVGTTRRHELKPLRPAMPRAAPLPPRSNALTVAHNVEDSGADGRVVVLRHAEDALPEGLNVLLHAAGAQLGHGSEANLSAVMLRQLDDAGDGVRRGGLRLQLPAQAAQHGRHTEATSSGEGAPRGFSPLHEPRPPARPTHLIDSLTAADMSAVRFVE